MFFCSSMGSTGEKRWVGDMFKSGWHSYMASTDWCRSWVYLPTKQLEHRNWSKRYKRSNAPSRLPSRKYEESENHKSWFCPACMQTRWGKIGIRLDCWWRHGFSSSCCAQLWAWKERNSAALGLQFRSVQNSINSVPDKIQLINILHIYQPTVFSLYIDP